MHAVVVRVTINDEDKAERELQEKVVPAVSQAPGFVAGYWTRKDSTGLSMVVFESEEAARQLADGMSSLIPDTVSFESAEVRRVAAHA
jgi:heme-degrading monooxygenase HmoA